MKVIVTGASKGIGRGIAATLARHGCTVGAMARSEEALTALEAEIRNAGGICCRATGDLRSMDSTASAIAQLMERLGGVDALINNGGIVLRRDIFEITPDEWHAMIETNVNGLFYATRAVLGAMREQERGHIINISSIAGKVPLKGGSAYAASKFACTGFSQSLFQEVRNHGIKVTTVYPGSVDSASHRHAPDEEAGWKVTPEEVGEVCWNVLDTRQQNLLAEVEIRPLARPGKG
ncbi:MAG: SDR family oxidoreductase [Candidatus Hydrogenedentota bacterium]